MPTLSDANLGRSFGVDSSPGLGVVLQSILNRKNFQEREDIRNAEAQTVQQKSQQISQLTNQINFARSPEERQAALVALSSLDPAAANSVASILKTGDQAQIDALKRDTDAWARMAFQIKQQRTLAGKTKVLSEFGTELLAGADPNDPQARAALDKIIELQTKDVQHLDLAADKMIFAATEINSLTERDDFAIAGMNGQPIQINRKTGERSELPTGPKPLTELGKINRDEDTQEITPAQAKKLRAALFTKEGAGGLEVSKLNPKDYTPGSLKIALEKQDASLLVRAPVDKFRKDLSPTGLKQQKEIARAQSESDFTKAVKTRIAISKIEANSPEGQAKQALLDLKVEEKKLNSGKAQMRAEAKQAKGFMLEGKIDEAVALANQWATTGFLGGILKEVGGTDARNLKATIDTIQA